MAQLAREWESPSLEVSQNCGDVALKDVVSGHGGVGWGWIGDHGVFPAHDSVSVEMQLCQAVVWEL